MGKQIAIALTASDEERFLEFLRRTAPIRLFASAAPSADSLWIDSFPPTKGMATFFIWNAAFSWVPKYDERNGSLFASNWTSGPVLEYSRAAFDAITGEARGGRLYWCTQMASPTSYDVVAFDKWYSAVARWLRKNSTAVKTSFATYYLPEAWKKYGSRQLPDS